MLGALGAAVALGGCGLGNLTGNANVPAHSVSVFHLRPGMCFSPPTKVVAEVSNLRVLSCRRPHTSEVFARIRARGAKGGAYPGAPKLETEANARCLEAFAPYVGVEYQHSTLFYTYLLPSVRSWTANDRQIVCVITTTGKKMSRSVRNSRQ